MTQDYGRTDWLTTEQAAEELGYSAESLRRWDREGRFKPSRRSPGGIRSYRRSDVEAFARSLESEPVQ